MISNLKYFYKKVIIKKIDILIKKKIVLLHLEQALENKIKLSIYLILKLKLIKLKIKRLNQKIEFYIKVYDKKNYNIFN